MMRKIKKNPSSLRSIPPRISLFRAWYSSTQSLKGQSNSLSLTSARKKLPRFALKRGTWNRWRSSQTDWWSLCSMPSIKRWLRQNVRSLKTERNPSQTFGSRNYRMLSKKKTCSSYFLNTVWSKVWKWRNHRQISDYKTLILCHVLLMSTSLLRIKLKRHKKRWTESRYYQGLTH